MTATTYIKINGVTVAAGQFNGKNEKTVTRNASHWLCDMEFNVRAMLKAAGVGHATITIGSDNVVIEHEWINATDSKFGLMREGRIVA